VADINPKIDRITDTDRTISASAATLASTVADIHNIVASIQDNARGINGSFATLFPVTTMIAYGPPPYGVQTINLNVDAVIARAQGIQADLGNIVVTVPEIDRHAVSICRSLLVMGPHCGSAVPPQTPAQPPAPTPAGGAVVPAAAGGIGGTGTR
jgi:hypothetical protein